MAKTISAAIGGVLLGILIMLAVARFWPASKPSPNEIVRDIVSVPRMAPAIAEKHRDEHYANLTTVEEIAALPAEFARSEALYALAGRSDSAGIQNLIFEANRVADEVDRVNFLIILFSRLAETDPQSALTLARIDQFKAVRTIEQIVWQVWARKNLDDALFAAKIQASVAQRNSAAQSLYAAFGYLGNKITERIESELGIEPDRSTRSRFLYKLADNSLAEAIAFINSLERSAKQQEYIAWLANYVSLQDAAAALPFADLFVVASDGKRFSNIVNNHIARENPQATIERLLASGRGAGSRSEFHSAISALAGTDIDAALQYFEQARSREERQVFGSAIALEMAKNNPSDALQWARTNDNAQMPYLQFTVIAQIANTDPQLAFTEALNTPNPQMRQMIVSNVVQIIAQDNPTRAIAYLDQIENKQQKQEATDQLVSSWMRQDAEAAMNWVLSQDKQRASQLIRTASYRMLNSDIDAAIRILPRLDKQDQVGMRQQIAQNLATTRSPGEAQSFIQQFEGQPGYDQLQASVISGVAQTDVLMAKQLADQLADGNARDTAYIQVIAQRAQTDPVEATRWLSNVNNESLRGSAAGQLASQWYASDPEAAVNWVSNLSAGSSRDDAIMQMSYQWEGSNSELDSLIASIEDRDRRGQAKIRQIYKLMQADPTRARKLLEDEDIPSYQRQQVETMINQSGIRF